MGLKITVDTKNFENLLAKELDKLSESKVQKVMKSVSKQVLADMRVVTPYDTGQLYKSYFYKKTGEYKAEFGLNIEYAAYQHEGGDSTRTIKNRPAGGETYFMLNTINKNYDNYLKILYTNLDYVTLKP